MGAVDVGPLEAFTHAVPTVVNVNGKEIAFVRWNDRCYGLRNICPHQTVSFVHGRAYDRIVGGAEFGSMEIVPDDPVLTCPRHAYRFRLLTGECIQNPRLRVRAYDVVVEDGRVLVDVDAEPPSRQSTER